MKEFANHVTELSELLRDQVRTARSNRALKAKIAAALDGQPSERLRALVSVERLRTDGVFFSGSPLAKRALRVLAGELTESSRIYDAACGAGDLLLACANHLPTRRTLHDTLKLWGQCLIGRDIHAEFISAAKYRLTLLAINRGVRPTFIEPTRYFQKLRVGRGELDKRCLHKATHLVLNPPFGHTVAPVECSWKRGRVSMAAVFLESCLENVLPGTRVIAILPDVLRSGTGYAAWRDVIAGLCDIRRVVIYGRFARWADVDVFILDARRTAEDRCTRRRSWPSLASSPQSLKQSFDISVGSVVDYRDEAKGPWMRFLCTRNSPRWTTINEINTRRRTTQKGVTPPFVVVRRTSSPSDRERASATIVTGTHPVAVENHLIVLRPKDRSFRSCKELLKVLRDYRTSAWLNKRIRCRHLTVAAVGEIPWLPDA